MHQRREEGGHAAAGERVQVGQQPHAGGVRRRARRPRAARPGAAPSSRPRRSCPGSAARPARRRRSGRARAGRSRARPPAAARRTAPRTGSSEQATTSSAPSCWPIASGPQTTTPCATSGSVVTASPAAQAAPSEDRHQPVRRQVEQHRVAGVEAELVDEQVGGLAHPVGVRRDRQLGALAGRVVVGRHQRLPGSPRSRAASRSGKVLGTDIGATVVRGPQAAGWQDAAHAFC